jgi:hypothetical protein
MDREEICAALRNLILGRGVRRGSHSLLLDGTDTTPLFLETLVQEGFLKTLVDEIDIAPGERVPAFLIEEGAACFGWVFWELFSPGRKRKVFASVVRNDKGDWAVIIGRGSKRALFANPRLVEQMDLEHPAEF